MTVLLEQFVQTLSESGLMTADELQKVLDEIPQGEAPSTGEQLAQLLFRRGKLTKYQAQAVYQGKAKGLVLGDYVILDKIGAGGMGQVFKARHRRMKRIVALKILPAETTKSPEAIQRFQQEVEAAAKLIHQNVATAFDAGETNKINFLVMELVDGTDLAGLLADRGTLPLGEALDYVLQAARGLKYAHEQGVVHRDIKPANMLLDKNGTIKILDMGLARSASQVDIEQSTAAAGLTRSGEIMGTVDYMSPEQASSTKHVDERADIYSLGCTLFFLLNGRPIYEGQTLVERVIAHREAAIPALSDVRKDVPKSWDATFRRMVAKKPDLRFRTMGDVIAALEKLEMPKDAAAGGGKPVPAARANAETRSPSRTARLEPKFEPRPEPRPEPKLTPAQKKERALKQVQEQQKKGERKQQWMDAVDEAVQDQRRMMGMNFWAKFRRMVGDTVATMTKWVLLILVLGGTSYGGYYLFQNWQTLSKSREQVLSVLNPRLHSMQFDDVPAIEFKSASMLFPVPDTLSFERPLFRTGAGGRRQVGTIAGEFQRAQGVLNITAPFKEQLKATPVP